LQLEFSRTRFSRKDRRYYSLSQASLLSIIKGLMRWQVDVPAGSVETARHTNGLKKFLVRFQSTKLIFWRTKKNYSKETWPLFYCFLFSIKLYCANLYFSYRL